jgi:hypothetical protein
MGFRVHLYNGTGAIRMEGLDNVIIAPGASATIAAWLGADQAQLLDDQTRAEIGRILTSDAVVVRRNWTEDDDTAALQAALDASMRAYEEEEEQRNQQRPEPRWKRQMKRHKSEGPAVGRPKCIVCLEKQATLVLVNCGCQVMCDDCIDYWADSCPNCRTAIETAPVHIFPSVVFSEEEVKEAEAELTESPSIKAA